MEFGSTYPSSLFDVGLLDGIGFIRGTSGVLPGLMTIGVGDVPGCLVGAGVGGGVSSSSGAGVAVGDGLSRGDGVGVGVRTFVLKFVLMFVGEVKLPLVLKLKLLSIPRFVFTFVFSR